MSGLALAAGLSLPALAAWGLLGRLLGPPPPTPLGRLGRAGAAAILGQGLAALLAFAWLLLGGALDARAARLDALLWCAAAAWLLRRPRPQPAPGGGVGDGPSAGGGAPLARGEALSAALLLLGLAAAAAALWWIFEAAPHGGWDAWAIWNQRARFLSRAGPEWRAAFAPGAAPGQPGYPPALPLLVARLFAFAGEAVAAPQALAALFTLATPAALAGAVAARAGAAAGGAAGLLLLGAVRWVDLGGLQYADVPVAAFLLLGAACAGPAGRGPAPRGAGLAAGLALGLAGLVKNEGLAGAAWLVVAWGALAVRRRGPAAAARELGALALGAAAPAAAWLAFRLLLVPEVAPAWVSGPGEALARLGDPARWGALLGALPASLPGTALLLPATLLAALLLGVSPRRLADWPALPGALAMTAGALAVVVLTPFDAGWMATKALWRLLLHAWPLLLLGLLGAAPAPPAGEAAAPGAEGV